LSGHPLLAAAPGPLTGSTVLTTWQFVAPVAAALGAAAALYLFGAWRVGRQHPARPWPLGRTACFLAGLGVVAVAIQSSIGVYDDVLFADHMVQHLLLIMVAPPLLVAGRPVTLLLHASHNPVHGWVKSAVRSRVVSLLSWPPVGLAIYTAVIVATHLTSFVNMTLTHPVVHGFEHALYVAAGYLFFLPIVGSEPIRWRISYLTRLLLLAIAMPVDTFTGVVLGFTNHELFSAYAHTGRHWGPSPLDDLHAGGAVMWVGGDGLMLLLILVLVVGFLGERSEDSGAGRWLEAARQAALAQHATAAGVAPATPTAGPIDDDETQLAAYNAYLAALSARVPGARKPPPR
jgi:putative copper resistance protein D